MEKDNNLSPSHDPQVTERLRKGLLGQEVVDFLGYHTKKGTVKIAPSSLFQIIFGEKPTKSDVAIIGRSLRALGWQRSYASGVLVYKIKSEQVR